MAEINSPTTADALWRALVTRCAASKPEDRDKVKRLVMVSPEDIRAALKELERV